MSDPKGPVEEDPGDVEPTDNSSGAPVDLDRVVEVEEERHLDEPDQEGLEAAP